MLCLLTVNNVTYEHQVFLRAATDRDFRSCVAVGFGGSSTGCCGSVEKFNLKPAMDLRRFAANARVAKSPSTVLSGDDA